MCKIRTFPAIIFFVYLRMFFDLELNYVARFYYAFLFRILIRALNYVS